MKLSDKIVRLRKSYGMSQEELAEKMKVSRQAISRWEVGTAMPDAGNILQLSKLFHVTSDYLLNDDYQSDDDLPIIQDKESDRVHQMTTLFIALEIMSLILQFTSIMILQSAGLSLISLIPFIAIIGGFEYGWGKRVHENNERLILFRKRFYKISAWLGSYFPVRLLVQNLINFYPRPINTFVLEGIILFLYFIIAAGLSALVEKGSGKKN
ncbi:helix-turn-helix domain-containing protein [Kallipyga gabonensis]|uniref:helix-turn-helix domain-containing protein n=1 Tax=Kallipyga gabonensis TaxID=1686287 RepID=UPI0006B610EA|nr:helix-turn-helix transcriptional regulator [Kallipyga gabonensis]